MLPSARVEKMQQYSHAVLSHMTHVHYIPFWLRSHSETLTLLGVVSLY